MNKSYQLVWNASLGVAQAVSEVSLLRSAAMLFSVSLCAPALADTVIDNGATETVPGTHASPWINTGALYVGQSGTGTLTILNTGTVQSGTVSGGSSGSVLGFDAGSNGTINVDGGAWYDGVDVTNTALTGGTTAVGGGGDGALNISGGGKVGLVFLNIGQNTGGTGSVVVDGAGSQLLATTQTGSGITVGTNGIGSLTISHGAQVISNSGSTVGYGQGSTGTVDISGPGSKWTITNGQLTVGGQGTGSLNISNGGVLQSEGGQVVSSSTGIGTASVSGVGSIWDTGTTSQLLIGYTDPGGAGVGTLEIANQGLVKAAAGVEVGGGAGTSLAIGAKEGAAAVAPGTLVAPSLFLTDSTSSLVFNHTDTTGNYQFSPTISGTGTVTSLSGTTVLNGVNTLFTGGTAIKGGTLIVGDATHPAATLNAKGAGDVTIASGGTLSGLGTVSGKVVNDGTVSALNALAGNSASPVSNFTLASGLVNNGTVNLAGGSVGNTLTIKGDYVGNNGTVVLNTVKSDDSSPTDRLVLDGGRASGNTSLVIKHAGGNGAQTDKGIMVVDTRNGATTDPNAFSLSSSSDGYRQGNGTLAAGPYDYSLMRGGNGGTSDSWYLVSSGATCATNALLCPPTPTPAPIPQQQLRPEVGSYLNNKLAASTMLFHTLHERQGQAPGMEGKDLNTSSDENTWIRVVGKTSERTGAGTMDISDTSYLIHAGGDLAQFQVGEEGSIRVGAMVAYGSSRSQADNGRISSRGSVAGYSAGVYGTWYGHRDILSGPYVDSWLMYGRFDNKVSGQGLPTERYKSSNFPASLEAGYSFPIYEAGNTRMFIEPQGQVIVSRYQAGNHAERNGTVVSDQASVDVTTRLGVRVHGNVDSDSGMKQMRPFVEVNWWHGPASQNLAFDGIKVSDGLSANRFEGKVGLQGNVSKAVSVWGSLGFETGTHDYTAGEAQLGVKYSM
ncbi:autotransporter outer membrane beta-barrel domain-containing protein [Pseudomonas purpurea]|uniref:autotransporter outer membrane beta-barrel domain-containing protein n=1 Tax=Pseudomonas purpurea TaxID=3136737 RepID=UPI003266D379